MTDLAGLLAKTFIARTDVKAMQNASGEYMPVQHCETCGRGFCQHNTPKVREAWRRINIQDHLDGNKTYGHYLLNGNDQCKFFAFDLDLDKPGLWPDVTPVYPFPYDILNGTDPRDPFLLNRYKFEDDKMIVDEDLYKEIREFHPRDAWLDRGHPARRWMKLQLKQVAHVLVSKIRSELEIPVAVTYTGAKGLHVYGLTGLMSASDVREGAQIVLDSLAESPLGAVSAVKGDCFYRFDNQDPIEGQPNLTIEVFPKQDTLDGKDLGNLMRLPLGRNLKNPKDPTFFVDMTSALADIKPLEPVYALTEAATQPWRRQGE